MITDFVSVTRLQRQANAVFSSGKPFQIVLGNNELKGLLISAPYAKLMLESNVFEEIMEELGELKDPETIRLVQSSKKYTKDMIPFDVYKKKHGF